MNEQHETPLHVGILSDGRLVVWLGIETLATAAKFHPAGPITVTNPTGFAHDVMAALTEEDEAGFSKITKMLDEAISAAVEAGSVHVKEEG